MWNCSWKWLRRRVGRPDYLCRERRPITSPLICQLQSFVGSSNLVTCFLTFELGSVAVLIVVGTGENRIVSLSLNLDTFDAHFRIQRGRSILLEADYSYGTVSSIYGEKIESLCTLVNLFNTQLSCLHLL